MNGVERIGFERYKQVNLKRFTSKHDDEHTGGELISAAIAYAEHAHAQDGEYLDSFVENTYCDGVPNKWPWEFASWKPSQDPTKNLAKAGALIAAEIDRLNRIKDY